MPQLNPHTLRDLHQGIIRPSSINSFLTPENSLSHSLNINYDTIIGSGVVRLGTTKLGATVAANLVPLGLTEYVTASAITNVAVGVFKGASNASIYYYNGSWITTSLTNLNNSSKVRFAQLGNSLFMANGSDAMKSSAGPTTWTTANCMTSRTPSLLIRTAGRMLASGDSGYRNRVWFSSIIDPSSVTFITWNENVSSGDFIDINPDDGAGDNTGLANVGTLTLVFKSRAIYRLNTISKTVDPDLVINIGAVSQEAITVCQGIAYFYSGLDIRSTSGDYPIQISRLGVQDFIDAIPLANQSSVALGNDGLNVYASIGNITLNTAQNTQTTYSNVVLKFSTRDQTWSLHSYSAAYRFFTQYTTTNNRFLFGAEDKGTVQAFNSGFTDNGSAIFYEGISQALEFGDLSHLKTISDKIVIFTQYAQGSGIQIKSDDDDFQDIPVVIKDSVQILKDISFRGNKFFVRWYGNSTGQSPIFEGFNIPNITDEGITK